jgi:hypothetical protein
MAMFHWLLVETERLSLVPTFLQLCMGIKQARPARLLWCRLCSHPGPATELPPGRRQCRGSKQALRCADRLRPTLHLGGQHTGAAGLRNLQQGLQLVSTHRRVSQGPAPHRRQHLQASHSSTHGRWRCSRVGPQTCASHQSAIAWLSGHRAIEQGAQAALNTGAKVGWQQCDVWKCDSRAPWRPASRSHPFSPR